MTAITSTAKGERRGDRAVQSLHETSPAEVAREVSGGDAIQACHPTLQAAVICVDVLDVENAVADMLAGGPVDRLVVEAGLAGDLGLGLAGIGAEQRVRSQRRQQLAADGLGLRIGEHGIAGGVGTVVHDQHRHQLGQGGAAPAYPHAAVAWPAAWRIELS